MAPVRWRILQKPQRKTVWSAGGNLEMYKAILVNLPSSLKSYDVGCNFQKPDQIQFMSTGALCLRSKGT